MLRHLLRRLPRFGFLTLFAAMLLFVSGAGRFKFEYDLYLEEERLLADLAKAGCQVHAQRGGEREARSPADDREGLRLPPIFERIDSLSILYDRPQARSIVERAASLPYLREFQAQPAPTATRAPPSPTRDFFAGVPIVLPSPRDAALPDLEQPLPVGRRLSDKEAASLLRSWNEAWSAEEPPPASYVARRIGQEEPFGDETIEIVSPQGILLAPGQGMLVENARDVSEIYRFPEGLLVCSRWEPEEGFAEVEPSVEPASTGRRYLERALEKLMALNRTREVIAGIDLDAIEAVRKTEEGLVRIDFAPMQFVRDDLSGDGLFVTKDELRLKLVLRPEREYPVETFDVHVVRESPKTGRSVTRFALRGVSSVHDDRYRLDAAALNVPIRPPSPRGVPSLNAYRNVYRFAYDFDAEIPPDVFDPATYGAVTFPEPRPLPFWRWYRVTLAIGLAIFAFVAGRKIVARLRRPSSPLRSSEAIEAPEASSTESAATF